MDRGEFISTLNRCLRKAFLDITWSFSTDEDQVARICLASDGHLILNYVSTPYYISRVKRVKYGIDELNENYYISIGMDDDTILQIGTARNTDYISLHTGNTNDIILYRNERKKLP